jgi:hypothetical protein
MPPASSARLRRLAGALALLSIVFVILLQGKPYFSNAAFPPRGIPDPGVALQVARDIEEVDDILGDAPSPDREVMRFKQYVDFGFILSYTGLFSALALLLSREGDWPRAAGIAAMVCGLATGAFDVLENLAILRILDVPLHATTAAMINAIRRASAAKWVLGAVTLLLLSAYFCSKAGWLPRVIGGLLILTATLILYGFEDNRFLVYQGYPALVALVGIAALFFACVSLK